VLVSFVLFSSSAFVLCCLVNASEDTWLL
jgi:hypothetical protein